MVKVGVIETCVTWVDPVLHMQLILNKNNVSRHAPSRSSVSLSRMSINQNSAESEVITLLQSNLMIFQSTTRCSK